MTLIVSLITKHHVFLVSDRRLTDIRTGQLVTDDENKAVDFAGQVIIAYTGLARILDQPTHLWLAHTLLGCSSVDEAAERIATRATRDFKKMQYPDSWKRHVFVLTGWRRLPEPRDIFPFVGIISNCHDEWMEESEKPHSEFRGWGRGLRETSSDNSYILHSFGQQLPAQVLSNLHRNLRACLRRPETGSRSYLRLLVAAMHETARSNSKVGNEFLAISIPETAAEFVLRDSHDGNWLMLDSIFAGPTNTSRTFWHYSERTEQETFYGPTFVFGYSILRGFLINRHEVDIQEIQVEFEKLDTRSIAGLTGFSDGRLGQFIGYPKTMFQAVDGHPGAYTLSLD